MLLGADDFDYDRELDLLWLSGDVLGVQGSRLIAADKLVYDRNSMDLVAKGNIFLTDPGGRLIADAAQMNLKSDRGELSRVRYRFTGQLNAHGSADQVELVRPTLSQYRNIDFSTCRPGQRAWSFDAAELELNQAAGQGVARNVKLRVRGLPVFYAPWLSFPIDDRRKSGILPPTIGNSKDRGIDITLPYYWNIAPNMDATLSARHMSRRGFMLGSKLRYLSSHRRMEIFGEVLPQDSRLESSGTRWALRIKENGVIGRGWSTALNYNAVSDDEYLEDFGNRLEQTSTRNIERRGDLNYSGDGWYLRTRLQEFQTLDATLPPASRPYARLPQVIFATDGRNSIGPGIEVGINGEYDYFYHDAIVYGHRAALQPFVRWPLRKHYGHLIPRINLYLAGYDLEDQESSRDARPAYLIPSFNLDAELVFERSLGWFGRESLQTIEPRLLFLHTPFRDQEDIPVFDSTPLSFSYTNLFAPNRFSGRDRIGDANQLTLGLTSRTLAGDTGQELLRISVGQTLYFRDREVRISAPPDTEASSSVAGLASVALPHNWRGHASVEYDPHRESEHLRKRTLELHYRTPDEQLLNLTYRFDPGIDQETEYEDIGLSFSLPVNPRLHLVGEWDYSLLNEHTVNAFAGLEYGRCCWRVRLLGHHLKNKPDSTGANRLMVQIELAGLGSIGQRIDKFLERNIYGYSTY